MGGALIVAMGNPLRSDDGAGPAAVTGLEGPGRSVRLVPELMPELAEEVAHAKTVVFVDAREASPGGAVQVLALEPSPHARMGTFSHALSPEGVLALAASLYGHRPKAFLVTVNGSDFELGEHLSPEVERALPSLRARILKLLCDSAPADR
ncbi:MAG TPA: hydrogenase maturation protease [Anaeromyxobacteraceae bacterium]|nr:hydrogenase maturation protease [Anaeromyxobacteraceae bacterium]